MILFLVCDHYKARMVLLIGYQLPPSRAARLLVRLRISFSNKPPQLVLLLQQLQVNHFGLLSIHH